MAAPTNFRVEAIADYTTILRWDNPGTLNVGIYRSTDGSSYSLITTVPAADEEYIDTDLDEKTRYWYKTSDDGGVTFSDVVTVVTYVVTPDTGIINSTPLAIQSNDPAGMYQELAQQIQALEAKNTLSKTPCDVCLVNGAIVLDCSKGCNWFRVVMDGDINSISVIGCEECPPCDFVIPPGETYSICGWPVGCEYTWDECHDAPLTGGTGGRTAKTNGLSYGGYGSPGGGPDKQNQCCECNQTVRIGAGDPLRIQCCESDGDCAMTCSESFKIKACGGLPPYTWSKSGNVSLSSTSGACITATSTQTSSGGGGSGINAWAKAIPEFSCTTSFPGGGSSCPTGKEAWCPGWFMWWDIYDCDQTTLREHRVDTGTAFSFETDGCAPHASAPPFTDNSCIHMYQSWVCEGNASSPFDNDWCGDLACKCCTNIGATTIRIVYDPSDCGRHSGATDIDESQSVTLCPAAHQAPDNPFVSWFDLRSQAQIDAGCTGSGCSQGPTTLTVTDAAGVSATVVIA